MLLMSLLELAFGQFFNDMFVCVYVSVRGSSCHLVKTILIPHLPCLSSSWPSGSFVFNHILVRVCVLGWNSSCHLVKTIVSSCFSCLCWNWSLASCFLSHVCPCLCNCLRLLMSTTWGYCHLMLLLSLFDLAFGQLFFCVCVPVWSYSVPGTPDHLKCVCAPKLIVSFFNYNVRVADWRLCCPVVKMHVWRTWFS